MQNSKVLDEQVSIIVEMECPKTFPDWKLYRTPAWQWYGEYNSHLSFLLHSLQVYAQHGMWGQATARACALYGAVEADQRVGHMETNRYILEWLDAMRWTAAMVHDRVNPRC